MDTDITRRRVLATVGVGSVALAGCLEDDEQEQSDNGNESADDDVSGNGSDDGGNGDGGNDDGSDGLTWPAIDDGESISDFDDFDSWETVSGSVEATSDEAVVGSQAAVLEGEDGRAAIRRRFHEPLDLVGWDTSLAVKTEAVERIVVEFIAPSGDARLVTVRNVPEDFTGWFRLDCGYEHKPGDEPDLSEVTQLNIIADNPSEEPVRMIVDDLRRTEAVDNGKAILALYDGFDSHYELAAPMLEERDWPAAVPVAPNRIGNGNRMDVEQLRELTDRGWDVCSLPGGEGDLLGMGENQRRQVIDAARRSLVDQGFEDGARHFFAPDWQQMDAETYDMIRDIHETGFLFGSCPVGAPPTDMHMIPLIWGPALHEGVRRHINLADQYGQLTVLRIPQLVEDGDDADDGQMSLDDFEHLLDHLEHRGLDVITPSDLVDGLGGGHDGGADEQADRPEGTILDAGETYSLEGSRSGESDEFELVDGLLVGEFSHDGDEFVVELATDDGESSASVLVEGNGTNSGESMVVVGEGTYRITADADDSWELELSQPAVHGDDLEDPPASASGSGTSFVGPFWTEGDLRVVASHDGDEAFRVDGHGIDGHREQLVSQDGEFSGSRSYGAGGVVWLTVDADGDWELEIESS